MLKQCAICKAFKEDTDYYYWFTRHRKYDTVFVCGSYCKPCHIAYCAERAKRNKEKDRPLKREQNRRWIQNNIDYHRKYRREYMRRYRAKKRQAAQ